MSIKKISTSVQYYKITLAILAFIYVKSIQAQNTNSLLKNYDPPSPEASSLGKYIDHPIDYFTGIPSIEIPLFDIQSGRLKIPIKLSYHASGIKIEEIPSRVGLGWTLMAGGVITRTVRGYPDEFQYEYACPFGDYDQSTCKVLGYFHYKNENIQNKDATLFGDAGTTYDLEPDTYFYSFPGKSGKLYFENIDKVILTEKKDIKIETPFIPVEFGERHCEELTCFKTNDNGFTITDNDGLIYRFVEKEWQSNESTCLPGNLGNTACYTSWYLSSIEDPTTEEKIEFKYQNINRIEYDMRKTSSFGGETGCSLKQLSIVPYGSCESRVSLQEVKVLDEIRYKSGYVKFYTDHERQDLINDKAYTRIAHYNSNDQLLKAYDFDYAYATKNNNQEAIAKRLYLKSITPIGREALVFSEGIPRLTETTTPPYIFSYNSINELPPRDSYEQDVWGYYNANQANSFLSKIYIYENIVNEPFNDDKVGYLPFEMDDRPASIVTNGNDRSCNPRVADYGMLQRIDYPTGGYKIFQYESNKFMMRKGNTRLSPYRFTGGGIRINKVISYSKKDKKPITTQYRYGTGYGFIPGPLPQLGFPAKLPKNDDYDSVLAKSWQNQAILGSNSGNYVGYTTVEVFKVDEEGSNLGWITYEYTDDLDKPTEIQVVKSCSPSILKHALEKTYFPFFEMENREIRRGKLKKISYFDNTDPHSQTPIKTIEHNYKLISRAHMNIWSTYESRVSSSIYLRLKSKRKIRSEQMLLTSTIEKDYTDNRISFKKETYYNYLDNNTRGGIDNLMLRAKAEVNNEGDRQITTFQYPFDFDTPVTNKMVDMHYLIPIIQENKVYYDYVVLGDPRDEDNNFSESYLTNSKITEYNFFGDSNKTFASKIWTAKLENPLETNQAPNTQNPANPNLELYENRVTYDQYDSIGNLLQYHIPDGSTTAMIWGYNNENLLLKAENTTYEELEGFAEDIKAVAQQDNDNCLEREDCNEQRLRDEIARLRVALPDAMITSYTYDPGIGLTSITSPSGIIEYYQYDTFNRLKSIKDHEGNIIKRFEYNYANHSDNEEEDGEEEENNNRDCAEEFFFCNIDCFGDRCFEECEQLRDECEQELEDDEQNIRNSIRFKRIENTENVVSGFINVPTRGTLVLQFSTEALSNPEAVSYEIRVNGILKQNIGQLPENFQMFFNERALIKISLLIQDGETGTAIARIRDFIPAEQENQVINIIEPNEITISVAPNINPAACEREFIQCTSRCFREDDEDQCIRDCERDQQDCLNGN